MGISVIVQRSEREKAGRNVVWPESLASADVDVTMAQR